MRSSLLALIMAASLSIGGCGSLLPEPESPPTTVDFGPAGDFDDVARLPVRVRLQAVEAPRSLDGTRMHYRRLDAEPNVVRSYARHAWSAPPAELLREHVDTMLHARSHEASPPQARLELRLARLEQVFVDDTRAYADARMTAVLHPAGGGTPVTRGFHARIDTPADVDGAISGLPAAADQLTRELGNWLGDTLAGSEP